MMCVEDLVISYGGIQAVRGISFDLAPGQIVGLAGLNGAGKSSTINALMGLVHSNGRISVDGEDLSDRSMIRRARRGLAIVPEGRRIFSALTVRENLYAVSGSVPRPRQKILSDTVFEIFPRLQERLGQVAGTLSGGEQQMLAIARALVQDPKYILVDEPSMGLAPILVNATYAALRRIADESKIGILLADQNVTSLVASSDQILVMRRGHLIVARCADETSAEAVTNLLMQVG